nr:TetR family transcriptional regulator [Streptomyces sp. AC550_RSS872]
MGRVSAPERRESVIRAAIAEFAIRGYHGTSIAAIAQRVGVTQSRLAFESAADGGGRRAGSSGPDERLRAADLDAPRNAPDADAGIRHRSGRRGEGRWPDR